MKTCFQIAECSLSYAKIMQTSAMKTCFQIAECSLSYAKISKKMKDFSLFNHFYILILNRPKNMSNLLYKSYNQLFFSVSLDR